MALALLPSPPAAAADPPPTSLVPLPPRPWFPRRPPFPCSGHQRRRRRRRRRTYHCQHGQRWTPSSCSKNSVVPLSNSRNDVIVVDTVTRYQVPCLHLAFGRQGVDEDGVQHVVVEGRSCCTHLCGNILSPTHLLEWVAPRRSRKNDKAPRDIGFNPCRLRALPRKECSPRFPRRGTPVQDTLVTLALESRRQEFPRQCMHVHTFTAVPPVGKYRVLGIQFPYGNVWRPIRHNGRQETYSFGVVHSVACPGGKFRILPTKCSGLTSQMSRWRQIITTPPFTAYV